MCCEQDVEDLSELLRYLQRRRGAKADEIRDWKRAPVAPAQNVAVHGHVGGRGVAAAFPRAAPGPRARGAGAAPGAAEPGAASRGEAWCARRGGLQGRPAEGGGRGGGAQHGAGRQRMIGYSDASLAVPE